MQVIDLTNQSMGWNNPFQTRATHQITAIGIHHSATDVGSQFIFENHWRNLGWRNGGYHEIILRNGDVEICYVPTTVTNGVGGHNTNTYHICVVGNSNFTVEQTGTLIERVRFNMNRFTVPVERVLGHNEFAGHMANICPGRNMDALRDHLRLPTVAPVPPSEAFTHTVVLGETLWSIAQQHQVTVETLRDLNNLSSNLIHPGQILRLPAPANQTQPDDQVLPIRVGSRVRVNDTAQSWVTGQTIPTWVRGQAYTVQQLRNNDNELLLADVRSWIHRRDVTLV